MHASVTPSFFTRGAVTTFGSAVSAVSRADNAVLSGVVSFAEGACNTTGGFTFSWSTNATVDASGTPLALSATASTQPSLVLPPRTLASSQTAAFTLTSCFTGNLLVCANTTLTFAVTQSPLVALIGGGGGVVGETPLSLSGAASYDPDGGTLAYAWSCVRTDNGSPSTACVERYGTAAVMGTAVTQTLQLAGAAGTGATYNITLTCRKAREAAAQRRC